MNKNLDWDQHKDQHAIPKENTMSKRLITQTNIYKDMTVIFAQKVLTQELGNPEA